MAKLAKIATSLVKMLQLLWNKFPQTMKLYLWILLEDFCLQTPFLVPFNFLTVSSSLLSDTTTK